MDEEDGRPLVEILRDWQDEDNEERDDGAEDDFYEDLDPPYFTPGRMLKHLMSSNGLKDLDFRKMIRIKEDYFLMKMAWRPVVSGPLKVLFLFLTKMD